MRRITKTHAPKELQDWLRKNHEINHSYDDLKGTEAHAALKMKLLEEQGAICAYTGQCISKDTAHVEHIKPQKECDEWEDVDYKNVVACFPGNGGDVSHGYGAPVKKGWWDEAQFVSPLMEDCEHHFRFSWSGKITPFPDEHEAAKQTIKQLNLGHEELRKLRKARIDGFFGFGRWRSTRPLTIDEARRALVNIDRLDESGRLKEFCFVLKQLLPKYICEENPDG